MATSTSASPPILQSLVELDRLRDLATTNDQITRVQNVDVIKVDGVDGDELALCHVPILAPMTRLRDATRELEFQDELENLAAAMLAMEHFNTGNGSIIPQVHAIDQRCNVRFTTEFVDTEHSESAAVEQVIEIVSRPQNKPCAFLGTTRSSVCIPTAIITGIKGYPQFSPECTSPQLNSPDQFPLFGRLINSDDGTALPVLQWLQQRANNLAILYRDDSYGIEYARALQHTAQEHAPHMKIDLIVLPYDGIQDADFDRAIQQLQDTQYRFVFAIISRSLHYDTLMTKAYEAGIAGTPDYTWIFSESLGTKLLSRDYEEGSPLHLATRGIGVITPIGGSPGTPIYEAYSQAMQQLNHNPNDMEYIKSKLPILSEDDTDAKEYDDHMESLSLSYPKETFSSLGYDTTIAFGLAACNASTDGTYFSGQEHFQAIVNNQFQGISGLIDLDTTTGSRNPESALFHIINFVEDSDNNLHNNNEEGVPPPDIIRFKGVVTDEYDEGAWVNLQQYLFQDGTSNAPLDLPAAEMDYNYIGRPLRAVGLTLSVVVMLASIGFAAWTYFRRRARVVRASQPLFLLLVCVGTLLMGASIIPLSIDDQIASVTGCNIGCMSSWWLLCTGFPIAFSALAAKTNRIVRIVYVGSFQRIAISTTDVLVPMMVFIGVNFAVLTMWTVLSPLEWVRVTTSKDIFGRPSDSYGSCQSEGSLPYIITLAVVNLGCLVAGVTQAYKARHLSTDFAESEYIGMAMTLMLVVGFIAIPVIILAEGNPGTFYFVVTAVVFVCSMSLLLLIFLPKVRSVRAGGGSVLSMKKSIMGSTRHNNPPSTFSTSFQCEMTASINNSESIGISCVNTEQMVPKLRRENNDLLSLTKALETRIRHLEEEERGDVVDIPESAVVDSTRRTNDGQSTTTTGMKVVDSREELHTVKNENKRLRHRRRELEARLLDLESNRSFNNDHA